MPFWHPKGMVVWRKLEEIRQRENAKRGYLEVKTPLIYDAETFSSRGTSRSTRRHVPRPTARTAVGLKAMNCPGTCSCSAASSELPRPAAALRRGATLHRKRARGTLHGLLARPASRRTTHIFCTADQIQDEIAAVVDYGRYLYELFGLTASASSPRGPRTSSAATRSGT